MAKTKKPSLKLSPLGRKLYAAEYEYQVLVYLVPNSGHLSEELRKDERYRRAHERALNAAWQCCRKIVGKIESKPVTISSLGDRGLVADLCDGADDGDVVQLLHAVASLTDLPDEWPWDGWRVDNPPPEAEAVVRKLLGKHKPKRRVLSCDEAKRIAAEAVAKAEAAIKAKPGYAPLFAAAA